MDPNILPCALGDMYPFMRRLRYTGQFNRSSANFPRVYLLIPTRAGHPSRRPDTYRSAWEDYHAWSAPTFEPLRTDHLTRPDQPLLLLLPRHRRLQIPMLQQGEWQSAHVQVEYLLLGPHRHTPVCRTMRDCRRPRRGRGHLHVMLGFIFVPCCPAFFSCPDSLRLFGLLVFNHQVHELTTTRFGGCRRR